MRLSCIGIDELVFATLIFFIINPISYARVSPIVFILLFFVWLLAAYAKSSKRMMRSLGSKSFVCACIYPLSLLVYSIRDSVLFERSSVIDCVIVLGMLFYISDVKSMKCIYTFIVAYLAIISVYSIFALLRNPMISRIMAGSAATSGNFLTGGYNTVYGLVLLTMALFGVIISRRHAKGIEYLSLISLFTVFIILSQYTTAVILLGMGCLLMMIGLNSRRRIILGTGVIVIFTFILSTPDLIFSIIYKISNIFPDGSFPQYRMYQLGEVLQNLSQGVLSSTTTVGTLSRVDHYKVTFETIDANLVWGVGNVSKNLITNHATFLDVIAKFGIFVGGTYIFFKIFVLWKISKKIPYELRFIYHIVSAVYIALSLLNTTDDMMISLILYVGVPYML